MQHDDGKNHQPGLGDGCLGSSHHRRNDAEEHGPAVNRQELARKQPDEKRRHQRRGKCGDRGAGNGQGDITLGEIGHDVTCPR
ncbi:hypothetical protein D3C80_1921210 [compost metagenome]